MPVVIDLNGDETPDIVFTSTSSDGFGDLEIGALRALSGSDGAELFTVTDYEFMVIGQIAAGDIDGDTLPEIVAVDASNNRLRALEHDGANKWLSGELETIWWGGPTIADLDGDGTPEIVIGRQALDNNGNLLWTGEHGRGGQWLGPVTPVADLNMDGSADVVAGNTAYTASGSTLWHNSALTDGFNAVADFDDDPYPEVVLVSEGTLSLLEHDGTAKWGPVSLPSWRGGPPAVGDLDNDGDLEIGVGCQTDYVVYEHDGTLKWSAPAWDYSAFSASSFFDLDADGVMEVLYRSQDTFFILNGLNGAVHYSLALSSSTGYEYPVVADIDNDGHAEVIVGANATIGGGPDFGLRVFEGANSDSSVKTPNHQKKRPWR